MSVTISFKCLRNWPEKRKFMLFYANFGACVCREWMSELIYQQSFTVRLLEAGQFEKKEPIKTRGPRLLVSNFVVDLLSVCFNVIGQFTKKAILCSQLTF